MSLIDSLLNTYAEQRVKLAAPVPPVPPPTESEIEAAIGRSLRSGEGVQTAEHSPISLAPRQIGEDVQAPFSVVEPSLTSPWNLLPTAINGYTDSMTAADAALMATLGYGAGKYFSPVGRILRNTANYAPGESVVGRMTPAGSSQLIEQFVTSKGPIDIRGSAFSGSPSRASYALFAGPRAGPSMAVPPQAVNVNAAKGETPTRGQRAAAGVNVALERGISFPGVDPLRAQTAPGVISTPRDPNARIPQTRWTAGREATTVPGSNQVFTGSRGARARTALPQLLGGPPRAQYGVGRWAPFAAAGVGAAIPAIYNKLFGSQYTPAGATAPTSTARPLFETESGTVENPGSGWWPF